MKGYRISFIRHGSTDANTGYAYVGGRTDIPLSDAGREELRDKALCEYPRVQKVYSSPLARCTETAEILFPDKKIALVEGLREMDFGEFEGKNLAELTDREDYRRWIRGGQDNAPPGGETLKELTARSYLAIDAMLRNMMYEELTHCAAVTHSGVIMNILSCFGLPKLRPMEFACAPGEGFEVLLTASLWQSGNCFEIVGRVPYQYPEEYYSDNIDDYDYENDIYNDYHGEFDL